MKTSDILPIAPFLAIACAAFPMAKAADLYSSGAKTWDTSSMNWGTVSSGPYNTAIWNNATPDSAILEGTGDTVTLGDAISITDLTINSNNYTIDGGGAFSLSFAGGGTINNTGNSVTITSAITGSPAVVPNQGGNQNLTFAPNFGSVAIGTVTRPVDNFINFGGSTTGNTLTSVIKGSNNAKVRFEGSGEWTVGDVYGGYIYIEDSVDLIVNGTLTCDYRQIQLNGGVLHYNNEAAIGPSEPFYIQGGDMDNSSGAAIATSLNNPSQEWRADWTFIGSNGANSDLYFGTGGVTIVGATREVTIQNAATTLTIDGSVTDGANGHGFTKAGPGTLELRGSHNYLGQTSVSEGTLVLGDATNNSSLSDDAVLEIATGATLNADWDAANVDTVFLLTFDGTPQVAGTWGSLASSATNKDARITGTGIINNLGAVYTDGSFFWDGANTGGTGDGASDGGAGTWSTSNANWDKGVTAREVWTNDTANKAIFGSSSGLVTLTSDITLGELIIDSTASSGYEIEGQTLNFGGTSSITTEADNVTITSGITGSPSVSAGTASGNSNVTFAPTSVNVTLGTVTRPTDNFLNLGGTTTGNTLSSVVKGNNNAKVRFNGTGTWTVGDVYGGFVYIDSGEVVVNGELTSDYRWIEMNGGVLHYNNPGAVKGPSNGSSSTLRFKIDGGSIDNTSGAAITASDWDPRQEWRGNWTFLGSNGANSDLYLGNGPVGMTTNIQLTVDNAATTLTVGGVISGSGHGLIKAGDGTLKLEGANTFTGAMALDEGTLSLGAADVIPDVTNIAMSNGTLDAATFTDTAGTLEVTGAATINLGTGGSLAFADSSAAPLASSWNSGTLNITGNFVSGASLRFGTTSGGLTAGQLALITVNGGGGPFSLDSSGYLVTSGGPGPVDSFDISAIGSPQVIGTAITGITITAKDASNNTATGFTGTVDFSGTGGFSGTSANFVAGELTGVSVTPTVAGDNLTLVVTDSGGPSTGSATITKIRTLYEDWSGELDFAVDTNGDGIDNGMAWLLGAADPNADATGLLPTATEDGSGNLVLTFSMLNAANRGAASIATQHSSDLGATDGWDAAGNEETVPDTTGTVGVVDFTITPGSPTNGVVATIPVGEANGGDTLFGRLLATE